MNGSTMFDGIGGLVSVLGDALRTAPGPVEIPVLEGRGVTDQAWPDVVFIGSRGTDDEDEENPNAGTQQWRTVGTGAERDENYTIQCAYVGQRGEWTTDIGLGRRRAKAVLQVIDFTLRHEGLTLGDTNSWPEGVPQIEWCEISTQSIAYQQSAGLVRVPFTVAVQALV